MLESFERNGTVFRRLPQPRIYREHTISGGRGGRVRNLSAEARNAEREKLTREQWPDVYILKAHTLRLGELQFCEGLPALPAWEHHIPETVIVPWYAWDALKRVVSELPESSFPLFPTVERGNVVRTLDALMNPEPPPPRPGYWNTGTLQYPPWLDVTLPGAAP